VGIVSMGSGVGERAPARWRAVAEAFELPGRWLGSRPYGSGHINETLLAVFDDGSGPVRFVQQRINGQVFREPEKVMENVARVSAHLLAALEREGAPERERRALVLVPARDGRPFWVDAEGETWRTWRFVEGTTSRDVVRGPDDARAAALAFARFQARLADLPGPRLHETIPRFQDARHRFEQLVAAARGDPEGRLAACRAEVDFALAREPLVDRLRALHEAGHLPERVTHGDTKINNVLLDERTGEGLCVIDLDTVMPGLALYDFGDLVRTAATRAAEDERDLARVRVEPELFAALAEGWLEGAGDHLVPAERAELVFAARLLPLVIGMRFLADHLLGDRYFRVHRPGHNLDRARAQLRLVAGMEREAGRLEEIVGALRPRRPAAG
jgi:aminoglycoside phosphotransferase (APT) family kinase protein